MIEHLTVALAERRSPAGGRAVGTTQITIRRHAVGYKQVVVIDLLDHHLLRVTHLYLIGNIDSISLSLLCHVGHLLHTVSIVVFHDGMIVIDGDGIVGIGPVDNPLTDTIQEIGITLCREINTDGAGTNDLSHFLAH